ncbi:hypothetical protein FB451DRAFT_1562916 [Mycena latifolia]|nr:hypothetical protein FB451DRAFT_1562916 [Mycena latifolia]
MHDTPPHMKDPPRTPPRTPPAFRPRAPPSPATPFRFNPLLAQAIPAGNYLILRGVYAALSKVVQPVVIATAKIAEIHASNASVRDIPVNVFPISDRDTSTSCYVRLDPSMNPADPSAEPRTDLLNLWIRALETTGWEVAWAPQEAKDKRSWVRVAGIDLLKERAVKEKPTQEEREAEEKVILSTRKVFDDAGFETVGGFKSGLAVTVVLAFPQHVDAAIARSNLKIGNITYTLSRGRQIEINYAFEMVISSIRNIDPSAKQNILAWFSSSFERDGLSLFLESREPRGESNHLVISMVDWEATHRVLTAPERFLKDLGHYNVSTPQLLYMLNTTAAWRHDPAAAIAEGTDKLSGSLTALTRRIENNEREARTRDADTKARITALDSSVSTIATIAATVARRQEELARGLFQLQQESQLNSSLSVIDSTMLMARRAIAHPVDDAEEREACEEFKELKAKKAELTDQLKAITGASILSAAPAIAPPPPASAPPPLPPPATESTPTAPTSPPGITRPMPDTPVDPSPPPKRP